MNGAIIDMNIELGPCIVCREDMAYVETEGNTWVYVQCPHCGSHTVPFAYGNAEERRKAEEQACMLWNMGKVIAEGNGV